MTYFSRELHQMTVLEGIDVPEETPAFPLPVSEVGLTNKTVWVRLPEGRLPFELSLFIGLQAFQRGIHMSRMEETLADLAADDFDDLGRYGETIARQAVKGQATDFCRVKLTGKMPMMHTAVISGKVSHDSLKITADIELHRQGENWLFKRKKGMSVYHMTACPCTQRYTEKALAQDRSSFPLPTHSQRSETSLSVETLKTPPSYASLYQCLEESVHLSQDLLKRPDEAEFVLKVHAEPQFAEDVVRHTATTAARKLTGLLSSACLLEVHTHSFESIHIHDVQCRLKMPLGKILQLLGDEEADREK